MVKGNIFCALQIRQPVEAPPEAPPVHSGVPLDDDPDDMALKNYMMRVVPDPRRHFIFTVDADGNCEQQPVSVETFEELMAEVKSIPVSLSIIYTHRDGVWERHESVD